MADKSKEQPKQEYPDTPSGKALAECGGDAEKYQAAKKKHRWG